MTDRADARPHCPICGRPVPSPSRPGGRSPAPFCSTRCADVDLGRWFTGQYRIADQGDDEPTAGTDGRDDGHGDG